MHRTSLLLLVVLASIVGCDAQADVASDAVPYAPSADSASKAATTPMQAFEQAPSLSENMLSEFEQKHSFELPTEYREFLLSNNGGFPSPSCVTFEEAGRRTTSDAFCFFAIGEERPGLSVDWHLETYANRIPNSTVPIGRDSGGNLWLLSLREDDLGSVFFWDHGSYASFDETDLANWPHVASSFQEFREGLTAYNASFENDGIPSRYSLAKQAADGMTTKHPDFSTRANPGFVWHCTCDAEGNINMEFVKYEIHAQTTHTCGYNRLRAINGLIQEGPTRLP